MSDSKRMRIIDAIHTLLSGNTSAGTRVYRGKQRFDEKDTLPSISIIPNDSEIVSGTGRVGQRLQFDWPITIQALVAASIDHPSDTLEPMLAEIKTYLFSADPPADNLGGECIDVTHVGDGGTETDEDIYTSASIQIMVRYVEHVGAPTN